MEVETVETIATPEYELVSNKKAKSSIWEHFYLKQNKSDKTIVSGVAVCQFCEATVKYSGGTTNLTTHISRHHPSRNVNLNKRRISSSSITADVKSEPELKQPKDSKPCQPTISNMLNMKYNAKSERSVTITNAVAKFIIEDLRPISLVEADSFKNMVKVLDPRYTLPSRTYFAHNVIPDFYEKCVAVVKTSISMAPCVAITTDGWTSRATESYVTITSTHINKDWQLENFVLQTRALPESHTGTNIAAVIKGAIDEWGIPPKPPLVTDNAANMYVAAKELESFPHIGCLAHTLNLAGQKALKVATVSRILGRVRRIVSFFHRSTTAAAVLRQKTVLLGIRQGRNLKLIMDVCTRWNSAADMLERFLELQPAVYASLCSKDIKYKESDVSTLSEADVKTAEEIMDCLIPLRDMTKAICTEKIPTVSIILPLLEKLRKIAEINNDDEPVIKQMKEAISTNLSTRYQSMELIEFLEECTVLDPRFKNFFAKEKTYAIHHRVRTACVAISAIKTEPGVKATSAKASCKPNTPALPTLPELEVETGAIADSQTEPDADLEIATLVQPEPATTSDSTDRGCTGLASILSDVIVVRTDVGQKSTIDRVHSELDHYKDQSQISLNSNPLEWWKENAIYYPLLSNVAKVRLCIPATSVPSERVFSTAGDIISAKRAALQPEMLDKLLFLKKNMRLALLK